jgi:hypothetical protein
MQRHSDVVDAQAERFGHLVIAEIFKKQHYQSFFCGSELANGFIQTGESAIIVCIGLLRGLDATRDVGRPACGGTVVQGCMSADKTN